MEEDNAIRALIIGVSVFLIVMTITAIFLYYNTAVKGARTVNESRRNVGSLYDKTVDELDGTTVTGTEARNIVRSKFEKYDTVNIEIKDTPTHTSFTCSLSADTAGNVKDTEVNQIKAEKNYELGLTEDITTNTLDITVTEQ